MTRVHRVHGYERGRGVGFGKGIILLVFIVSNLIDESQSFGREATPIALERTALFRARSGDFSVGTMRSITIPSPPGWRRVQSINKDPLSLAQWSLREPTCTTGATSRLSVYAVDVGKAGPQKLIQKWFPETLKFHVGEAERGFVIVRAEAESSGTQAVIAYPLSHEHITPLAGPMSGVNILMIAESTTQSSEELEKTVRHAIRSQIPVRTENAKGMDVPFVLFGEEWHKTIADRLEAGVKRGDPNAIISKAFSLFNDAEGFIPTGQQLLFKAAEKGSASAQLDLIRLARRRLLTIDLDETKLEQWKKSLAKAGSEDARYWATEAHQFSELESRPQISSRKDLKELSSCGHPEARRMWAKILVQSFKPGDRFNGRNIVMGIMRAPPLEGTLPITTRVPRAIEAPGIEQLKAAALLKTACPHQDDPELDLFTNAADFKIGAKEKLKVDSDVEAEDETEVESAAPSELLQVAKLDKMVNSGSMKTLKEAQELACNWPGGELDRNKLVIEIAARKNDGFGKWRRFRTCDFVKENTIATFCREQELRQAKKNTESRYRDFLVTVEPELRNSLANLRDRASTFHDVLLKQSYGVGRTVAETLELDRIRHEMDTEFLNLIAVSLNQNLQAQINDVVTGRRLMILPPTDESATFSLKRQSASTTFIKKELERLDARMNDTILSISEADREDLSIEFRKGLLAAHSAWKDYRNSYKSFSGLLAERGRSNAATQTAADLWFHIEGIYYIEKIRDREIGRSDIPPESERIPASADNGVMSSMNKDAD